MLRALSDRLYDSCVKRDTLACLGLKAFYATARFAEAPEALAQVSARRARVREATADRVLVGSAAALLSTSLRQARDTLAHDARRPAPHAPAHDQGGGASGGGGGGDAESREAAPTAAPAEDEPEDDEVDEDDVGTDRRRTGLVMTRKMLFPLLIGVVLKLASLIPIVLGKLTLLGTMALMSSKMSLLILGLMSLRRFLGGGGAEASGGGGHMVPEPTYYSQVRFFSDLLQIFLEIH
ncbi:hypothetical protein R5R35_010992 [Gryllus longicercus]|uniref:Uncharacterized protein n=1 Tax=Gryllus longicercus TaxID=2509291 RepID=A0AAN9YWK3_9ORTH